MAAMSEYIQRARTPEKKARLQLQWLDAVQRMEITCCCGQLRALELAYRCLYCGEWYCFPCAEIHFGMTVAEWNKKKDLTHDHPGSQEGDCCRAQDSAAPA